MIEPTAHVIARGCAAIRTRDAHLGLTWCADPRCVRCFGDKAAACLDPQCSVPHVNIETTPELVDDWDPAGNQWGLFDAE